MINSKSTETFLSDCNLTEMVGSTLLLQKHFQNRKKTICKISFLNFILSKVGSLDDLNNYFVQPEEDLRYGHMSCEDNISLKDNLNNI